LQKVLVIGASGAMGRHLVPILAGRGYDVAGVSLDAVESTLPNVRYLQARLNDWNDYWPILSENYDAVVDFMTYPTARLAEMLPRLVESTGHYIYLSSCRIYDNLEVPIREDSPLLIDTSKDQILRNSDDYCIYKARGERILNALPRRNWTAVRPSTTYSYLRYQLVTLEAADTVGRARAGKPVAVPETARHIPATLCWGGDAARLIAGLLFNEAAFGEAYTVSTSEAHTWEEIAEYYKDLCNLQAVWIDQEDFLRIKGGNPCPLSVRWQLEYARLFTRIYDNAKVLAATGLKQSEMMPLYSGLKREIERCPLDHPWVTHARMDAYFAKLNTCAVK
jgi:nucleoside-diphosphate-sugar epimerase